MNLYTELKLEATQDLYYKSFSFIIFLHLFLLNVAVLVSGLMI